jgi:hypothetical protein
MSNMCLLLQQYSLIYVIFGSQVDTSVVTWVYVRLSVASPAKSNSF